MIARITKTPILPDVTPRQAFDAPSRCVNVKDSIGELSATTICPYPPGIPLIFPGEEITEDAIASLTQISNFGGRIIGGSDEMNASLEILDL